MLKEESSCYMIITTIDIVCQKFEVFNLPNAIGIAATPHSDFWSEEYSA